MAASHHIPFEVLFILDLIFYNFLFLKKKTLERKINILNFVKFKFPQLLNNVRLSINNYNALIYQFRPRFTGLKIALDYKS